MKKLEASTEECYIHTSELEPDFEFTQYTGLSDKEYPIWQEIDLHGDYLFIHDAEIEDYGYYIDDLMQDDEFPKFTSGTNGRAEAGSLSLKLQALDRFGCRLFLRGNLNGSSAEMSLDIRIRLRVRGCRVDGKQALGHIAEAVAEGYAFGEERRFKQEFFQYFSALDSYIHIRRLQHNKTASESEIIGETERLSDKFKKLVKAQCRAKSIELNDIVSWSSIYGNFTNLETLRNEIAHNITSREVEQNVAEQCLLTLVFLFSFLTAGTFSEDAIENFFES